MRRGVKRVVLSLTMALIFTLTSTTNIYSMTRSGSRGEKKLTEVALAYSAVKPKAPAGLKVWKANSNKLNIQWNQVPGVDGYHVYYKKDDGEWKFAPDENGNPKLFKWMPNITCTFSNLKGVALIAFQVASVKNGTESTLSNIVAIKVLDIKKVNDINVTVNQNEGYFLPATVPALMSDGSTREVSVKWDKSSADTSRGGQFIYKGSIAGYKIGIKLKLNVKTKAVSIRTIDDIKITVNQNEKYLLPNVVSALMSDGSAREVAVKWDKSSADTSKAGDFIYIGSVAGYKSSVTLTISVKTVELPIKDIAKKYGTAVVYIEVQDRYHKTFASGSGFIVTTDGSVVTNFHVIEKAAYATVTLSGGAKYEVEGVLNYNKVQDIAILKLKNASALSCVVLGDSSKIELGDNVLAIGSPIGLENSLSIGIVSGLNRQSGRGNTDIQTTAGIASGSSGGALFNMKGEVIGITYAGYDSSGDLGFAIPINEVLPYLKGGSFKTLLELNGINLKPETPKGLKAWPAEGNKINIQWDPVDGVDGYYLCVSYPSDPSKWYYWVDDKGNKTLLKWYNGSSATLTDVKAGEVCYFKVASVKDGVESDYSAPVTVTMAASVKAPTGIRAWTMPGNEIRIYWDQVDGAEGYYLYYSTDNINWAYFKDANGNKKMGKWYSDYSASLTGVKEGVTYYFRVTAVMGGAESPASSTAIITYSSAAKPLAPTGLKAWPVEDGKFYIQWDQVSGVDGYYVYYSLDQKNWDFWDDGNGGKKLLPWKAEHSASLTGNKDGEVVYFKVSSVKNGVESDSSVIASSTYISVPKNLRAWLVGSDIYIQWDQVSAADGYHLSYSLDLVKWQGWQDDKGVKKLLPWYSDRSGILTDITRPLTIYFKVASVKNGVESIYCAPLTFTIN